LHQRFDHLSFLYRDVSPPRIQTVKVFVVTISRTFSQKLSHLASIPARHFILSSWELLFAIRHHCIAPAHTGGQSQEDGSITFGLLACLPFQNIDCTLHIAMALCAGRRCRLHNCFLPESYYSLVNYFCCGVEDLRGGWMDGWDWEMRDLHLRLMLLG